MRRFPSGMGTNAGVLALVLVMAGCAGVSPTESPDPSASARDVEAYGAIAGRVFDDEMRPVEAASVIVDGQGLTAQTDGSGSFLLEKVPAGPRLLVAQKTGFETASATVEIRAGETGQVELRLNRLASHVPHNVTHPFQGHYDCAHEIPIWTGDCMILYEAATNETDPYTSETYVFPFEVGPRWESIVVELTWEGSANNQLDGMRIYLEHVTDQATGHSVKVGRADGSENPLRFVVHRGQPHPRADTDPDTEQPATFPAEGDIAQIRVYPHGHFYEESCTVGQLLIQACTLGVGAGIDLRFDVAATVFYNERAPDGFSAWPS